MNLICGESAHGQTRIFTGPCYYLHLRQFEDELTPDIYNALPKQPAWTKMNKDWKKRK